MMAQITADSMKLCERIESLLAKATKDSDAFGDFAQENEEIVKYAFLARAVVRGLIEPLPELFTSIASIEEEFSEYASQLEDYDDEEEEDDE
jgi:phage-related protein